MNDLGFMVDMIEAQLAETGTVTLGRGVAGSFVGVVRSLVNEQQKTLERAEMAEAKADSPCKYIEELLFDLTVSGGMHWREVDDVNLNSIGRVRVFRGQWGRPGGYGAMNNLFVPMMMEGKRPPWLLVADSESFDVCGGTPREQALLQTLYGKILESPLTILLPDLDEES